MRFHGRSQFLEAVYGVRGHWPNSTHCHSRPTTLLELQVFVAVFIAQRRQGSILVLIKATLHLSCTQGKQLHVMSRFTGWHVEYLLLIKQQLEFHLLDSFRQVV